MLISLVHLRVARGLDPNKILFAGLYHDFSITDPALISVKIAAKSLAAVLILPYETEVDVEVKATVNIDKASKDGTGIAKVGDDI
jgi:hypothetical protein